MLKLPSQPTCDVPPSAIHQWQWEESVNILRRRTRESAIQTHWKTTGVTTIDATARAHIGEWLALDVMPDAPAISTSIIDAIVHRRLRQQHWDLYLIEASRGDEISVRCLRHHRGYRVRWLEGRCAPEVGSTVALRLIHLDPPGLWASTLPVDLGDEPTRSQLIMALLRSFGAHQFSSWERFMSGPGARIILEYGLSNLEQMATYHQRDDPQSLLVQLERDFARLECRLQREPNAVCREVELSDKQVVWLEDIADGPHLLLFADRSQLRRYQRMMNSAPHDSDAAQSTEWCRAYRACPEQLSPVECAMGALAGLRPARDGLVRIQRRNARRHTIDPRPRDVRSLRIACRRMAAPARLHAA